MGETLQAVALENLDCGSDPNLLVEPEEWSLVAASAETMENMMKEILSLACMGGEGLGAIWSSEASLGSESGGEWDEAGGEHRNEVKVGTTAANDSVSSEPATALPSARMGMELKSSSDTIAPEKEAFTSIPSGTGLAMQIGRESGLPEPTGPITPLVSSTTARSQLKFKPGKRGRARASNGAKQREESKCPMGSLTEGELKWATGPGAGNGVSGTLSSLVVPPQETATNAWGATNVPQAPAIMDWDDEFADILGPIPIGTKPFVFPDSSPVNVHAMNPLPATTSALAPRRKPVSIHPPVRNISEVGMAKNTPDHFSTPCVPQTSPHSFALDPGMSSINQRLNAAEAEQRLLEFDSTSEGTQKLDKIPGVLATQAASKRKAKDITRLSSLDPVPKKDPDDVKSLNKQSDREERVRAVRARLRERGFVKDFGPRALRT